VAADGEGAAGVGVGQRGLPGLVAQPATQQAGHEAVARTQHVIDLDRESRPRQALIEAGGDIPVKCRRPHRAKLADQDSTRNFPHRMQGGDGFGHPPCNMKLLFSANNQIE
jgi:hypothetical protein